MFIPVLIMYCQCNLNGNSKVALRQDFCLINNVIILLSHNHTYPMKLPQKISKGFTLVELLVVIAIIAVLAALATPAIMKALQKASIAKAKGICSNFEIAVNNFESEYNHLPFEGTDPPSDDNSPYKSDTSEIVSILAGAEDPDSSNAQNFKGIRFFELGEPKGTSASNYKNGMKITGNNAQLYDPWGIDTQKAGSGVYHIIFDYNYDGKIKNPLDSSKDVGGKKVIVYSYGPDKEKGSSKLNRDNATNF